MYGLYKGRFGRWGQLGSAYNDSLTLMEKIKLLKEMHDDLYNNELELNQTMSDLLKWVNEDGFPVYLNDKLQKMLESGELETLINDALFKLKADLTYVDTQLNYRTVPLRKYYTNDFSEALRKALADGHKEINIDGSFNVSSAFDVTGLAGVKLIGHAKLNLLNDITSLIVIRKSSDIYVDTISLNGNNLQNYRLIWFDDCANVTLNRVFVKDVWNKDNNFGTYNVYVYAKDYTINQVELSNINQFIEPSDITTGRGSMTGVYVAVDSTHTNGYIGNVIARDYHNVDVNRGIIFGDSDVIKTQRHENESNAIVRSQLVIDSVVGHNFGKRLVKLQAGGVSINSLIGTTDKIDGYSAIGIQAPNVTVNTIDINSGVSSLVCAVELGYICDNITIKSLLCRGTFTGNLISLISQTWDTVDRVASNISINNVILNSVQCGNFLALLSRVSNYTMENIRGTVVCESDFIIHTRNTMTSGELTFTNMDVNITAPHFVNLKQYPMTTLALDFIDSKIVFNQSGTTSQRLLEVNSGGQVTFSNTNMVINNPIYEFGVIQLRGLNDVFITNSVINTNNGMGLFDITSNNIFLSDVNFGTSNSYLRPVNNAKINDAIVGTFFLYKGGTTSAIVTSNGLTGKLNVATAGDVIVESTKIYKAVVPVTLTSGVGVATVTYTDRMTSVNILNAYVIGRATTRVTPKDLTSFTSGTLDVVDSSSYSGTVNVTVLYTY